MKTMEKATQVVIAATSLELVQGDITQQNTDAIVNAANSSLLGSGGVDGAIHRAAGPELLAETRTLGGCETGDARISRGYRLQAKYVIHAVGPIYRRNDPNVPRLLASAYRRSMEIATEHKLESIAFSAISTGIYGYPIDLAAHIALDTVVTFLKENETSLSLVRFVLHTTDTMHQFQQELDKMIQARQQLHDP
jgi:O-acetyl-ADP-ribose deacetylase (regulator of RNase III)